MPSHDLDGRLLRLVTEENAKTFAGGGEPPHNGGMEARVAKLEDFAAETRDRLARIETKLDHFQTTFATKEDLYKALNAQTWKIVSAIFVAGSALTAIVYFLALNNVPPT